MRKKTTNLWCLALLFSLLWQGAMAAPISRQQALGLAQRQLQGRTFDEPKAMRGTGSQATTQAAYYVFNATESQGFVVVAGDDRLPAILGYAPQGTLDPEAAPADVRYWLNGYEQAVASLTDSDQPLAAPASQEAALRPAISPLVKTTWHQELPYNAFCPEVEGHRTLVGCVATAMAQVINYYRWPRTATAAVDAFTSSSNSIKMDALEPTSFPWGGMSYADDARLCLYCGQSVRMNYGADGSGASGTMIPAALANVFGYDQNVHYVMRSSYSTQQWDDIIYNELAASRPVIYCAADPKQGGHCFICDGYDGYGRFHINWGWAGLADTYFNLSVLKPRTGENFSQRQGAVVGIQPPTGEPRQQFPSLTVTNMSLENASTTLTRSLFNRYQFRFNIYSERHNTGDKQLNDVYLAYQLYQDGKAVADIEPQAEATIEEFATGIYAYGTDRLTFGSGLKDGTYQIVPVHRFGQKGSYAPDEGANINYVEATVSGNTMKLRLNTGDSDTEPDTPIIIPDDPGPGYGDPDEMWWGYFNGTEKIAALGTGKAETFDVAIHIPAGHPFVSNSTISAMRVWLQSKANTKDMKLWVATSLPTDVDKADYVQPVDISRLADGHNNILLNTPFKVSGRDIYVGYTFTINEPDYAITQGGDNVPYSLFMRSSQTKPQWDEMSNYGKLALQLLIEGGPYPNNLATPSDFGSMAVQIGQTVTKAVSITNQGKDPIESLGYIVTINGHASDETTIPVTANLPYGATAKVDFTFPADVVEGEVPVALTITSVNGEENLATEYTANGTLVTVAQLKSWPRTVLIEEFTSEGCDDCPLATALLDATFEEHPELKSQVAIASHHAGADRDWLTIDESEQYTWFYNSDTTYAPAFMWDRTPADKYTPVWSIGNVAQNKQHIEERLQVVPNAGISLTTTLNNDRTQLTVDALCERNYDFSETPARITLFLTEDNIAAQNQANGGDDYVHQHVLRAVSETWGTPLSWQDNAASYSHTFAIDPSWKAADLKVIAFISTYDENTPNKCQVENATVVSVLGIKGDVNHDGFVDVGDVMAVINVMASDSAPFSDSADVNGDKQVDVGDVMAIINIMAGN